MNPKSERSEELRGGESRRAGIIREDKETERANQTNEGAYFAAIGKSLSAKAKMLPFSLPSLANSHNKTCFVRHKVRAKSFLEGFDVNPPIICPLDASLA
jgi:hypothetical protein